VPEVSRSTVEAEALNRRGADLIGTDLEAAEEILRAALTKDLFFGPAHNNLGVVYLKQKKLYEAASEFEWARKLLPGSADPRINLALTLEAAGRTSEAFKAYEAALEVEPESVAAMQGAASLVVRGGQDDPRLAAWLDRMALQGEDGRWWEWARARHTRP
jgi:tetratricopeptide (TPR) repeat protein